MSCSATVLCEIAVSGASGAQRAEQSERWAIHFGAPRGNLQIQLLAIRQGRR
jgi:hypothetical protein